MTSEPCSEWRGLLRVTDMDELNSATTNSRIEQIQRALLANDDLAFKAYIYSVSCDLGCALIPANR